VSAAPPQSSQTQLTPYLRDTINVATQRAETAVTAHDGGASTQRARLSPGALASNQWPRQQQNGLLHHIWCIAQVHTCVRARVDTCVWLHVSILACGCGCGCGGGCECGCETSRGQHMNRSPSARCSHTHALTHSHVSLRLLTTALTHTRSASVGISLWSSLSRRGRNTIPTEQFRWHFLGTKSYNAAIATLSLVVTFVGATTLTAVPDEVCLRPT
jgi:hypothetical protein